MTAAIWCSSRTSHCVADDTNGVADIYVVDRRNAGRRCRYGLSVTSQQQQAIGGESVTPAISAAGRLVAFASRATNLVPDDTNGAMDIFVHDRDTDGDGVFDEPGAVATTRVSVGPTGAQADGDKQRTDDQRQRPLGGVRVVGAHICGAGDRRSGPDVFVRDRALGDDHRGDATGVGAGSGASGHQSRWPLRRLRVSVAGARRRRHQRC